MTFEEFSRQVDLQSASHRGLTRELIPNWIRHPELDLNAEIESSAYGETPAELIALILRQLGITKDDIFLDVGAGGGNVLFAAAPLVGEAWGLERNPKLVALGLEYQETVSAPNVHLVEGDLRFVEWPPATKLYAATSRFSDSLLAHLTSLVEKAATLSKVATLGRPLQLSKEWSVSHLSEQEVCWNPREVNLCEDLHVWERVRA